MVNNEVQKRLIEYYRVRRDLLLGISSQLPQSDTRDRIMEMLAAEKKSPDTFSLTQLEKAAIDFIGAGANKEQLEIVGAVLGLSPTVIHTYTVNECISVLSQKKYDDMPRLARSIAELMVGDERAELVQRLSALLSELARIQQEAYSWEEAFVLTLELVGMYDGLYASSEDTQKQILKNYFYRGIIVGAPVRKACDSILYATDSPFGYMMASKLLLEALNENGENVYLDAEGQKIKLLKEIMGDYFKYAGENWAEAGKQEAFVNSICTGGQDKRHEWLNEALSIYIHIKNADLIPRNRGSELTEQELYFNDTVQLLVWFGIGDAASEDVVRYFSQSHPRVPLKAFVSKLKEIADVNQEVTLENIMELTEKLHERKLLPDNEELVEFQEKDGTFSWNERIIS